MTLLKRHIRTHVWLKCVYVFKWVLVDVHAVLCTINKRGNSKAFWWLNIWKCFVRFHPATCIFCASPPLHTHTLFLSVTVFKEWQIEMATHILKYIASFTIRIELPERTIRRDECVKPLQIKYKTTNTNNGTQKKKPTTSQEWETKAKKIEWKMDRWRERATHGNTH